MKIKIKQFRIDPPIQCLAKHQNYLGNEDLRMERKINSDLKHRVTMLQYGPIELNLTKWRQSKDLIRKARTGITENGWRIVSDSISNNHYFLFLEPVVALVIPPQPRWARVTRQTKAIVPQRTSRRSPRR